MKETERLRRELRRMQVNADRVARIRAIKLPEGGSEDYQQGVMDMAVLIQRALEEGYNGG
jgi:hypothetical protein